MRKRIFTWLGKEFIELSGEAKAAGTDATPPSKAVAKKVAKAVTKDMPPIAPSIEVAVREVVGREIDIPIPDPSAGRRFS